MWGLRAVNYEISARAWPQDGRRRSTRPATTSSPATAPRQRTASPSRPAPRRAPAQHLARAYGIPRRNSDHDPDEARRPHPGRHRRPPSLRARAGRSSRRQVIASRSAGRIPVGPVVTLVFENRETIRFQVQEMARAEKIVTTRPHPDRARHVQPADPRAGQPWRRPCSSSSRRRGRPAQRGCPRWSASRGPSDSGSTLRSCRPPSTPITTSSSPGRASPHRSTTSTSRSTPQQVERFAAATGVRLEIDLPAYQEGADLDKATRSELLTDLLG